MFVSTPNHDAWDKVLFKQKAQDGDRLLPAPSLLEFFSDLLIRRLARARTPLVVLAAFLIRELTLPSAGRVHFVIIRASRRAFTRLAGQLALVTAKALILTLTFKFAVGLIAHCDLRTTFRIVFIIWHICSP
jgi:hypothetical protein